jgi:hypothetical protein
MEHDTSSKWFRIAAPRRIPEVMIGRRPLLVTYRLYVLSSVSQNCPSTCNLYSITTNQAATAAYWWPTGHEHPQHVVAALACVVQAPANSFAEYKVAQAMAGTQTMLFFRFRPFFVVNGLDLSISLTPRGAAPSKPALGRGRYR